MDEEARSKIREALRRNRIAVLERLRGNQWQPESQPKQEPVAGSENADVKADQPDKAAPK